MKPTDQLTVLEAMALGYALAGKEQAAKIFALVPAATWLGPLGDMARALQAGGSVDVSPLGIESYVSAGVMMKEVVDELIVAEVDKRRKQVAMGLKRVADKMIDPKLPGNTITQAGITELLNQARGLYEDDEKAKKGAGSTASGRSNAVPGNLEQANPKASGSHQATGSTAQRV